MLIVMKSGATEADVERVCEVIQRLGFDARPIPGGHRTAIGIVGNDRAIDPAPFVGLPGVAQTISVSAPFKQVSREWQEDETTVTLSNGASLGGGAFAIMAGPCSIESEEQIHAAAAGVALAGGRILRGGAFKPRTSPYSFQGLGEQALRWMSAAAREHGLATVTEAVDAATAERVAEHADMIQIGARNMQNYALLSVVGQLGKPILLKRGMSATIKEWLLAAEYIANAGQPNIVLCERGIRSFDATTRNVLDLGAMVAAKQRSHLPVIADPSHGTGRRDMVEALSLAAVAAGADGLIVEAHPDPDAALSDGAQSLFLDQLSRLVERTGSVRAAISVQSGLRAD